MLLKHGLPVGYMNGHADAMASHVKDIALTEAYQLI